MINLKIDDNKISVHLAFNDKKIGDIEPSDDGYYVFWPIEQRGYWNEQILEVIAEELKLLNAGWDAEINKYFEEEAKEVFPGFQIGSLEEFPKIPPAPSERN